MTILPPRELLGPKGRPKVNISFGKERMKKENLKTKF
jgi:hypothetical protein